jgi:putative peptidoglycan lipid II flippase
MTSSVPRAAGLATIATFAGYGATLVQQAVYARAIGVGPDADSLAAALTWAVSVTGLLGTVFAGVVIPSYSRLALSNSRDARAFFQVANGRVLVLGLVIAAGSIAFASGLAAALVPGAPDEQRALLERLLQLSAVLQLLWIAVLTAIALANARGLYVAAALSTVVPSIPVIAVLAAPGSSVERAMLGYILGAALQLAFLAIVLRPHWRDYAPRLGSAARTGLERTAVSIAVAFVLFNATGLVARSLSSLAGPGELAIFDYATRLTNAAEQVLLAGALAVVLTTWSTDAASASTARLPIPIALRSALVLVAMVAGGLIALGTDFARVLLQGGQFSAEDTVRLGEILAWIAPGMAAHMLLMLAVRAHLAHGGARALIAAALVGLVVFGGAALLFRELQLTGIAISFSVAWAASATTSIAYLNLGNEANRALIREGIRSTLAAAGTTVLTVLLLSQMAPSSLARLAIGSSTYVVIGLVLASALDLYLVRASMTRVVQHRGVRRRSAKSGS